MVKIKNVEPIIVSVPLDKPKKISTRPIKSREYLITKITTDNGIIGWGLTFGGLELRGIIENELKPILLGEDPDSVEYLWNDMFNKTIRWGRRGIYIRAISALDISIWDIRCKNYHLALYQFLGGLNKKIPVYASGGYYKLEPGVDEVETIAEEMQGHVNEGFSAAKMKVGIDLQLDIERMRTARDILGSKRKLFVDVNNGWRINELTPNIISQIEEIGIDWIEEPFMPDSIEENIWLREKTNIPIANGEILSTRWDFKQLLETNSCDIWQPDVTVLGGVSEWNKILTIASIWKIPVAPHAMHEIHSQLAAANPNSETYIVEYFDTTGDIVNYGKLLKNNCMAKDGFLEISDTPGVGMDFDEAKIDKYRIK